MSAEGFGRFDAMRHGEFPHCVIFPLLHPLVTPNSLTRPESPTHHVSGGIPPGVPHLP